MRDGDQGAAELLHMMGHLYLKSGEKKRGLVLLLIAAHAAPAHVGILHSLSRAFIAVGDAPRALEALDRIEQLQGASPALVLLQSRALWADGQRDEARRRFHDYLQLRGSA
ncbi:type III secretion protein [Billgrantia tianxiuensis]|jgi:type III secretion protein Y|uniref:Type III secretion protein n=1 Tax=Billgrantia tianxiuensis TaxID=2497861 RepID=A0A6I6SR48_9GAMM|nr:MULTISPECIES: type III secretion protein [Halomonas]MCE8033368.1 type III secretion protein [Halomonas sp. MCCC 1A11057]QHC49093.1 type III secretion protein [Halomonas tianxiuensis]